MKLANTSVLLSLGIGAQAWSSPMLSSNFCWRRSRSTLQAKLGEDDPSSATVSQSLPPTYIQRSFYQLKENSDVDVPKSVVVEARSRYRRVGDNRLQKVGLNALILRDGDVEDGEIGDDVFVMETPADIDSAAAICTCLYLASNPESLVQGEVLEIAAGDVGMAGLLGCIAAGYVVRRDTPATDQATPEDDILTLPQDTPGVFPPTLEHLTLTEQTEVQAHNILTHCKEAGVMHHNRVLVEPLDWTQRPLRRMQQAPSPPKEYQTLVASDVAFSFPEAKELARTVAYRLAPLSLNKTPRFVHIAPDSRDDTVYLRQCLEKGYKMTVSPTYLSMECIHFLPQQLEAGQDEALLDEMELEVKDMRSLDFSIMVAQHHPDYDGEGSGELFFPAETGAGETEGEWLQ